MGESRLSLYDRVSGGQVGWVNALWLGSVYGCGSADPEAVAEEKSFFRPLQVMLRLLLLWFCLNSLFASGRVHALESSGVEQRPVEHFKFHVFLDDRQIGFHHFKIERAGGLETVHIQADFKVEVFKIPFYKYRHDNIEQWRDGWLESISSSTNDNGKRYKLDGQRRAADFKIENGDGLRTLESSRVMSFAYWNKAFTLQKQLLNAQNGDYVSVEIKPCGVEDLRIGEKLVEAEKYQVFSESGEIEVCVWYAKNTSRWLCLESKVAGGRLLRYRQATTEIHSH